MFAKPETFLHALEEYDIFISTQSACSTSTISRAVLELTKDEEKAEHSLRISLSGLTTNEEIDIEINHAQRYDHYRIDSVYCLLFGTGTGE